MRKSEETDHAPDPPPAGQAGRLPDNVFTMVASDCYGLMNICSGLVLAARNQGKGDTGGGDEGRGGQKKSDAPGRRLFGRRGWEYFGGPCETLVRL